MELRTTDVVWGGVCASLFQGLEFRAPVIICAKFHMFFPCARVFSHIKKNMLAGGLHTLKFLLDVNKCVSVCDTRTGVQSSMYFHLVRS